MGWTEFLRYASSTGVAVVVGAVFSELVNFVPRFGSLPSKWKRACFFLTCLIVPLTASVLGVLTAGWPASWSQTFWPALVSGFVQFASGTIAHMRKVKDRRLEMESLLEQLREAQEQAKETEISVPWREGSASAERGHGVTGGKSW